MICYDQRTGRYYDDETGEWVSTPPAEAGAPMSQGQAIAALMMLPIVFVWVMDSYGVDVLAWIDRLGR